MIIQNLTVGMERKVFLTVRKVQLNIITACDRKWADGFGGLKIWMLFEFLNYISKSQLNEHWNLLPIAIGASGS